MRHWGRAVGRTTAPLLSKTQYLLLKHLILLQQNIHEVIPRGILLLLLLLLLLTR